MQYLQTTRLKCWIYFKNYAQSNLGTVFLFYKLCDQNVRPFFIKILHSKTLELYKICNVVKYWNCNPLRVTAQSKSGIVFLVILRSHRSVNRCDAQTVEEKFETAFFINCCTVIVWKFFLTPTALLKSRKSLILLTVQRINFTGSLILLEDGS